MNSVVSALFLILIFSTRRLAAGEEQIFSETYRYVNTTGNSNSPHLSPNSGNMTWNSADGADFTPGSTGFNVSPTPAPQSSFTNNSDWDTTTSVDILVAALFLIAAGWLILAIIYSVLILVIVRMRARGDLDIYDENFGRIFLLGRRCYIPLGWLLRRHVVGFNRRNQTIHLMTREERRCAMDQLLTERGSGDDAVDCEEINEDEAEPTEKVEQSPIVGSTGVQTRDHESDGEPICSICLTEYEEEDACFTSTTCVHRFHRDCLMDWLERRNHTECPCCREPMVSDDDVWETVQRIRRERRKLRRREARKKGLLGWCGCCVRDGIADAHLQGGVGEDLENGNSSNGGVEAHPAPPLVEDTEGQDSFPGGQGRSSQLTLTVADESDEHAACFEQSDDAVEEDKLSSECDQGRDNDAKGNVANFGTCSDQQADTCTEKEAEINVADSANSAKIRDAEQAVTHVVGKYVHAPHIFCEF